ncbi:metalloregulator ArsR/SmtB family transcription factor [Rhodococcus sp. ACS1]|uniref:ArsR/SmtB family transcription factor n=1 Tax=Rhodococcus sp. ACS1 TaxID=2028570 RepID=UPI00211C6765|nr:metalloregulator ArsR/SmtB family transcription factor [Rhodococcus sp. ACS1]
MPRYPQLEDDVTEDVSPPRAPIAAAELHASAALFGMLAATARLHIIWLLCEGERDVGTLATEVGQTVAAVSQHLAKLKLAGLVRARREGRRMVYLVDDPGVAEIVALALGHHPRRDHRTRGGRTA